MKFKIGDEIIVKLKEGNEGDHGGYYNGEKGIVVAYSEDRYADYIIKFDEFRDHYYVNKEEIILNPICRTPLYEALK